MLNLWDTIEHRIGQIYTTLFRKQLYSYFFVSYYIYFFTHVYLKWTFEGKLNSLEFIDLDALDSSDLWIFSMSNSSCIVLNLHQVSS